MTVTKPGPAAVVDGAGAAPSAAMVELTETAGEWRLTVSVDADSLQALAANASAHPDQPVHFAAQVRISPNLVPGDAFPAAATLTRQVSGRVAPMAPDST